MPDSSEWTASVGQAWRDALPGLEATLAPFNSVLADTLRLGGATHVVDVGCGGGGLTRYLAQAAGPNTRVTGIDISRAMIQVARQSEPSDTVEFVCADATHHKLAGAPADRLTSRFGVMFFDDEAKAFANLRSWLATDGRFAFAVWGPMDANPWMDVVRQEIARELSLPPSDPGQPGAVRYADPNRLLQVLQTAGFESSTVTDWTGSLQLGGGLAAPDAARFGLRAFWGDCVSEGSPIYTRIAERLTARLREHERYGRVEMAAHALIFSGAA